MKRTSDSDISKKYNNTVPAILYKSGTYYDSDYAYEHDHGYDLNEICVPSHKIEFNSGRYNDKIDVHNTKYNPRGTNIMVSESLVSKLKQIADMEDQIRSIKSNIKDEFKELFESIKN